MVDNLSKSIAKKLLFLKKGESLPASQIPKKWQLFLEDEGIIRKQHIGRSKGKLTLVSEKSLKDFILNRYGIKDLENYIELIESKTTTGREAQKITGDTKFRSKRTFEGFLINSFSQVQATLKGKNIHIQPEGGSCLFISEPRNFAVSEQVTIVGVENPEVFTNIHDYKHLFPQRDYLFVSRFPATRDLIKWLKDIPNPYLHFGDIDLSGIAIFQNEYQKHLGSRARFFIPPGLNGLLKKYGTRKLYDKQFQKYRNISSADPDLQEVIKLIHQLRMGLEQEGLAIIK